MGNSIYDYVSSEASSSTTGGWNTAENQDPSTVNDGMRAHKQNVAKFLKDVGGTITTTGSANAHAATLNQPIATTVPTGFAFKVKWGYTNTSATVNLNINSIGNARVKVILDGTISDPLPGDIRAGDYGHFIYDGTQFILLNPARRGAYELIETKVASSSATIEFTSINTARYHSYEIIGDGIIPATDATFLWFRCSVAGSFLSTAIYNHNHFRFTASGSGLDGATGDTKIIVSSSAEALGTGGAEVFGFKMTLFDCTNTGLTKRCLLDSMYLSATPLQIRDVGGGTYTPGAAVDGFQFLMSSGNIAAGTFKLYGRVG